MRQYGNVASRDPGEFGAICTPDPHDAEDGKSGSSRGTPVFAEWIGVLEALIMDSIEGYWPLPVDTGATKSGGRS